MLVAFLVFPLSLVTVSFQGLRAYAEDTSSLPLARQVEALTPAGGLTVAALDAYPVGLAFYLRRPLVLLTDNGEETTSNYIPFYLSRTRAWPPQVVPAARTAGWVQGRSGALLVLARKERKATLATLAAAGSGAVLEMPRGWWGLLLPPPSPR